ncbi:MAG TPA: hypothetical protein VGB77_08260 [Abditibacteriaceae bacterium]
MLDSFLLCGAASTPPEPIELRAGPLHLLFEPQTGMIRRICYGEIEIWRGLYAAVRDHNWGTVTPRLFNLKTNIKDDAFEISFDVECKQDDIDFLWHGVLQGTNEGLIEYQFQGVARSNFQRNRIGFCLLHPPQCAGAFCELEHVDGSRKTTQFPKDIAPHQPFFNLHSISHEFASGQWAQAIFEGDVFETEDQRNWTDASFKTYCTPLDLPFPIEVKTGDVVEQKVTLSLDFDMPLTDSIRQQWRSTTQPKESKPIVIEIASQNAFSLPAIGLCMASHGEPLTENEIARLRLLNLSHLRADLKFNTNWQAKLQQASHEAKALNIQLELALHLPREAKDVLHEVIKALEENDASIARFLIFSQGEKVTSEATARVAREVLGSHGAPIVGGTDFYFTEINRQHPPLDLLDGICFSITPQVHIFDDLSLMENLEMQATVVENAQRLFGLPIHISPVTFKKRGNPDATGAELQMLPDELPPDVDLRQMSLFGAAWTLGSLKTLCEAGAASLTYYETTGMKGVMQQENAASHSQFPAPPGTVFPLFYALQIGEDSRGEIFEAKSSSPSQVIALHIWDGAQFYLWIANLTAIKQNVRFRGRYRKAYLSILNSDTVLQTMNLERFMGSEWQSINLKTGLLSLPPYALARLSLPW